jgi:hypothetical protein
VRHLRLLVFGAGAALLPFAVVAFFTWARDGVAAGLPVLLGHGELAPATTLMAAQAIATSYGAPMPLRTPHWVFAVAISWGLLALTSLSLVVPYAGRGGYERRLAAASGVLFAASVGARGWAIRFE